MKKLKLVFQLHASKLHAWINGWNLIPGEMDSKLDFLNHEDVDDSERFEGQLIITVDRLVVKDLCSSRMQIANSISGVQRKRRLFNHDW